MSEAKYRLSHHRDGWWLWDSTVSMNLAIRAPSRDAAIDEAIAFYQRRLAELKAKNNDLSAKLDRISKILGNEDGENNDE